MGPVETVLRRARNILRTKGWTQDYEAKDAEGNDVHYWSDKAVCFCSVGALRRAAHELDANKPSDLANHNFERSRVAGFYLLRDEIISSYGDCTLMSYWNDKVERRKSHVLAMFGKAADRAKAEGM